MDLQHSHLRTTVSGVNLSMFPKKPFLCFNPERNATLLAIASLAIERCFDRALSPVQRKFLYMPFQHSEDADVQARSVALFATIDDTDTLAYARRHKEIIDRFGRFPHRNASLGRESTEEELAFLKEPKSVF